MIFTLCSASFISKAQVLALFDSLEIALTKSDYRVVLNSVDNFLTDHPVPDSTYARLFKYKAIAYEKLGALDSVFHMYTAIVTRKPDDYIALTYLSNAYGDSGYYKEMTKVLYQLKRYYPNEHWWATNMSYYLGEGGYFELSKNYADTSLQLANDSTWIGVALNNRSYAYIGLGLFEKALEDNERALNYFPANSFAYRNKALILLSKLDTTKACTALFKAKSLGGVVITEELIETYCEND